jgi:hypothetical protein
MLHITKIHGRFALNSLTHDSYSVTCVGTRKKNHVLLFFRMCQYKLIKSFLHWLKVWEGMSLERRWRFGIQNGMDCAMTNQFSGGSYLQNKRTHLDAKLEDWTACDKTGTPTCM